MKVKSVKFNWHKKGSLLSNEGAGEEYDYAEVGKFGVISIEENPPTQEKHEYDYLIHLGDGSKVRVFNPNTIRYYSE